MKLSKQTLEILKNFSTINTNLLIREGKKISTISASKVIMAEFEGEDEFEEQVAFSNLQEFLGAYSTFSGPEMTLDKKFLTIQEGSRKLRYVYANEDVLIVPQKSITMPASDVTINLTAETISKIQKFGAILNVDDLAIVGDGKTISIKILDKKNPTANTFEIDLEVETTKTFNVYFKVENLRLYVADYTVELVKKISKWSATGIKLTVYIAVESDSTF